MIRKLKMKGLQRDHSISSFYFYLTSGRLAWARATQRTSCWLSPSWVRVSSSTEYARVPFPKSAAVSFWRKFSLSALSRADAILRSIFLILLKITVKQDLVFEKHILW